MQFADISSHKLQRKHWLILILAEQVRNLGRTICPHKHELKQWLNNFTSRFIPLQTNHSKFKSNSPLFYQNSLAPWTANELVIYLKRFDYV